MMRRIAQDIGQGLAALQPSYEVVVVGSGYGAGVAASRLARAGRQVALLERGLEHLPGEFPASLNQARGAMRVDTAAPDPVAAANAKVLGVQPGQQR